MKMLKKAVFSTAIASVRTFDPKDPAEAVGRTAENAIGKAAADASPPELRRTEQRWLMDTGCPYELTARGSIPSDWLDAIYQDEPVVLATANGEIRSVYIINIPSAAFSVSDSKARRQAVFGAEEAVHAQP